MQAQQKRKRYQKDSAPPDDVITLIHLVKQNPVLYNYKLQPNQRRRSDVLNGWVQIANQIGNRYTVEECRRKWKNLRDTYHQYRLRKPKLVDGGLSKWRYAKELDFLSNVYQPKLKSNRQQYDNSANILIKHEDDHSTNGIMHHGTTQISLDCSETFILTAYDEEGVSDDVVTIDHGGHDDPTMGSMDLTQDDEVVDNDLIKNEHSNSLDVDDDEDDDGATGGEVGYEEVCMYEEAPNASSVDCETIIDTGSSVGRANSPDGKDYQYLDTSEFISTRNHFSTTGGNVLGVGTKFKNISLVNTANGQTIIPISFTSSQTPSTDSILHSSSSTSSSNNNEAKPSLTTNTILQINPQHATHHHHHQHQQQIQQQQQVQQHQQQQQLQQSHQQQQVQQHQQQQQQLQQQGSVSSSGNSTGSASSTATIIYPPNCDTRVELDLFFDFLKTKMQKFTNAEITDIQLEFLNCISKMEHAQKNDIIEVIDSEN